MTTQKLLRNILVVYLVPTVMLYTMLSNEKKNKTTKGRFKKRIDFQFIIFWKFLNIKMVGGVNP